MPKILFVMTGAAHWTLADGTEHPTGYWAEEFAVPYEVFRGAGYDIVVATPDGVVPTVDKSSLTAEANGGAAGSTQVTETLAGASELEHPVRLADVRVADYDAIYYPGGHGPMEDLAVNADSARILTDALASGNPLGLVCHAPAALLATAADGSSPFAGYRLTGFTNAEETHAGLADRAKWLLQDRLVALGVDFRADEPWAPHTETDRNLYTGQNPTSSAPLAAKILQALK